MTALEIRPITRDQARAFVQQNHRHNDAPVGWLFGAALYAGAELRAVGMAGRPAARHLQNGRTIELTRVCTLGDRNAASRLYGALCRAAAALGYQRAITYTLESEPGSSVAAAGFRRDGETPARVHGRPDGSPRTADRPTLFYAPRTTAGERKTRWIREL